jgi:hypothetical protein
MPPGEGAGFQLTFVAGNLAQNISYAYRPPQIRSVTNGNNLPTLGGVNVTIDGFNFGAANIGTLFALHCTLIGSLF